MRFSPGTSLINYTIDPYRKSRFILSLPKWRIRFLMIFAGFLTLFLPASGMFRLGSSVEASISVFPSLIAPSLPALAVSLGRVIIVLDTPLLLLGIIVGMFLSLNITLIQYLNSQDCDCRVELGEAYRAGLERGKLTLFRTIVSTAIPLISASSCCIGILPVALSAAGLGLGAISFVLVLTKFWIPIAAGSLLLLHHNSYVLAKRIQGSTSLRLGSFV
ncbi:hypothetical protein APE_2567 [Aeropyrum pernix K1]|uniref:Uncharacterized protein n=1 Tax=Aeropyrum pernix (strain ATCC 700893 / DSM 11879 / JCM 9820 / NBRC 100138 / K1) TaxID=272557 RepID=Q9Y8R6_AERPE|nr:hypothetical protein [Aeropyrum pernix]BAA81584.1 hypothetical protein APE_2567 [Aeropyrum pernix K1]